MSYFQNQFLEGGDTTPLLSARNISGHNQQNCHLWVVQLRLLNPKMRYWNKSTTTFLGAPARETTAVKVNIITKHHGHLPKDVPVWRSGNGKRIRMHFRLLRRIGTLLSPEGLSSSEQFMPKLLRKLPVVDELDRRPVPGADRRFIRRKLRRLGRRITNGHTKHSTKCSLGPSGVFFFGTFHRN